MPTSARAECTAFTEAFGEFATSSRADVGIGPYIQKTGSCGFMIDFRKMLHSVRADRVVRPYAGLGNHAEKIEA